MNEDHFALVIGLATYATLGDPPPANLKGPEHDAAAITGWLTDPVGGALPPQNVKTLVSSQFPQNQPGRDELEDSAFMWVEALATANRAAHRGRSVGRRLYFHVSGHGFSPQNNQGCLIAANAYDNLPNRNIGVSAWQQFWQDAGYFDEFVLTMDCCMNRMESVIAGTAPLQAIVTNKPRGPTFVAFAAQRALLAVERPIPEAGGKVHGIFTWCLLQGLKGAAANVQGRVTGHSLADWLRVSVRPWMEAGDLNDINVSKSPEIVTEDEALMIARNVTPVQFDIALRFDPTCAGQAGQSWSGVPPRPEPFTVGMDAVARLRLRAGLHAAEVTAGGVTWRQAFAATRTAEIMVIERGPCIVPPAADLLLTLATGDPGAFIRVIDANFHVVESGQGRLSASLPFGVYLAAIQIDHKFVDQFIILDQPWPATASLESRSPGLPPMPQFNSAAPLPGTVATHEYHESAVANAKQPDVAPGAGAELLVMARSFTPNYGRSPVRKPWEGVQVLDGKGEVIVDLSTQGFRVDGENDPFAICLAAVSPGAYTLRYRLPRTGAMFERSLFVPPAADGGAPWRLEAYMLLRTEDGSAAADADQAVSLLMHRDGSRDPAGDLALEKARVALADERPIMTEEVSRLLLETQLTVISGIVGAHLILLGMDKGKPAVVQLDPLVQKLRSIAGTEHPDIEALSLRCTDPALRRIAPITTPPLLERSWRLMVAAGQSAPDLVSLELWQQVHAAASAPPYLVWSPDATVKSAYTDELREALTRPPRPDPTPPSQAVQWFKQGGSGSIAAGFKDLKGLGVPDATPSVGTNFSIDPRPQHSPPHSLEHRPTAVADVTADRARALGLPPAAVRLLQAPTRR